MQDSDFVVGHLAELVDFVKTEVEMGDLESCLFQLVGAFAVEKTAAVCASFYANAHETQIWNLCGICQNHSFDASFYHYLLVSVAAEACPPYFSDYLLKMSD